MKNEKRIISALGEVNESFIEEASPSNKKGTHIVLYRNCAIAACLVLFLAIGIYTITMQQNQINLSSASKNVTVSYSDGGIATSSSAALVFLSEEEIFSKYSTVIFKGTITEIKNIVIDYNGVKDYRALAKIEVSDVYRGDFNVGDTLTILLPCPINAGFAIEDNDTIASMRVGMTGIFMPVKYDKTSTRSENGATLSLTDIANYGFLDGSRFAFLQSDSGLIYAEWAYESIENVTSLDEIEQYIKDMLNKSN